METYWNLPGLSREEFPKDVGRYSFSGNSLVREALSRLSPRGPHLVSHISAKAVFMAYGLYSHQTLEKSVHDWALVYEWPGSDSSLKPILLTAHQDVVPVLPASLPQWDHPPYSGYYDGQDIWGRGSSDTKSSLIAIMAAIEHLLETTDFKPTRTIILGFGSDEERGGQVS